MTVRPVEASALRALTQEAADLPLPTIDWERVERKLLSAVVEPLAHSPAPAPAHRIDAPRRTGSAWAVALAAAAAVAMVAAPRSTRSPASSEVNGVGHATQGVNAVSDSIPREAAESGTQALSYQRAGVVSFTLAPESRVEMVASEGQGSMTVTLIRGSIHADVTPRPDGEVFAVEVGHTRIAAHGTSFTVSRQGDQAVVDIDHGAVAVGPVGHPGSTQGWLLVGPDRAQFSLDGAREARWLGPEVAPSAKTTTTKPATPHASANAAPSLPSHVATSEPSIPSKSVPVVSAVQAPIANEEKHTAPEAPLPAERSGDATAAILRGLEVCYDRQVSSLGVRFSIQSSLSLTVLPNGTIREGVFTPPLSPTLMSCAREAISAAHYPRGESVTQISVPVRLSPPQGD